MIRDLWDTKLATTRQQTAALVRELKATEKQGEQLLDRVVEATSDAIIAAIHRDRPRREP